MIAASERCSSQAGGILSGLSYSLSVQVFRFAVYQCIVEVQTSYFAGGREPQLTSLHMI